MTLVFSCVYVFVFQCWDQQKLEKVIQSPKSGVTDGDNMSKLGAQR